jgi:hypothetical protein
MSRPTAEKVRGILDDHDRRLVGLGIRGHMDVYPRCGQPVELGLGVRGAVFPHHEQCGERRRRLLVDGIASFLSPVFCIKNVSFR